MKDIEIELVDLLLVALEVQVDQLANGPAIPLVFLICIYPLHPQQLAPLHLHLKYRFNMNKQLLP